MKRSGFIGSNTCGIARRADAKVEDSVAVDVAPHRKLTTRSAAATITMLASKSKLHELLQDTGAPPAAT